MVCLSRPCHFKFFKGCLPKIPLCPFWNTWTQINLYPYEACWSEWCSEPSRCTLWEKMENLAKSSLALIVWIKWNMKVALRALQNLTYWLKVNQKGTGGTSLCYTHFICFLTFMSQEICIVLFLKSERLLTLSSRALF